MEFLFNGKEIPNFFCHYLYEVYFPASVEHKGFLTSKRFLTRWKKIVPCHRFLMLTIGDDSLHFKMSETDSAYDQLDFWNPSLNEWALIFLYVFFASTLSGLQEYSMRGVLVDGSSF